MVWLQGVAVLVCVAWLYWCLLQVQTTVADDFALNLNSVLLDLCKPFMDPTNPKAAAIELALCHRSDVLNLTKSVSAHECTRVVMVVLSVSSPSVHTSGAVSQQPICAHEW